MSNLTIDMLRDAVRSLNEGPAYPPPHRVVFTKMAVNPTGERLFPPSKHRSLRIRKKLIKRFGGEYHHTPCIYEFMGVLYVHPALKHMLQSKTGAPL